MTNSPDFDLQAAHKFFSSSCFNQSWDLIDKTERSAEEDIQMILLSLASLWHWTQREDCTDRNLSVAYWQVSRIYTMLGKSEKAREYGQKCLEISFHADLEPFYLAYAYEALARAEAKVKHLSKMQSYLEEARKLAEKVSDLSAKKQLLDDLVTIE